MYSQTNSAAWAWYKTKRTVKKYKQYLLNVNACNITYSQKNWQFTLIFAERRKASQYKTSQLVRLECINYQAENCLSSNFQEVRFYFDSLVLTTYVNHSIYLFLENIRTDTTDQNSYWSLLIIRLVYVSFSQFQLFKHIMYSQTNSQVQWEDPILNLKTVKIVCVTSFNCPTCSLKLSNVVCF